MVMARKPRNAMAAATIKTMNAPEVTGIGGAYRMFFDQRA
jgi:hypothetical protein